MHDLPFLSESFSYSTYTHNRSAHFTQQLLLPDKVRTCSGHTNVPSLLETCKGKKASISRHSSIWNACGTFGEKMSRWHGHVWFLIFSFTEGSSLAAHCTFLARIMKIDKILHSFLDFSTRLTYTFAALERNMNTRHYTTIKVFCAIGKTDLWPHNYRGNNVSNDHYSWALRIYCVPGILLLPVRIRQLFITATTYPTISNYRRFTLHSGFQRFQPMVGWACAEAEHDGRSRAATLWQWGETKRERARQK